MKLTEDLINEIRNSASISEVIGHYIPLVKKGKGFTALCPFHDDHDPSLSISEDKQIYKCFVCGNGGNVYNFVMNFKKVSFPESVKEVADIIGKPIDIEIHKNVKKVDKNQKYYDLLNKFIDETNYLLTSTNAGLKAKEYLKNRQINDELINKFKIGFNPLDDFMYKYLHQNEFSDEDQITVGVSRMMNNGMKDVFYNRILFPIYNEYGNPVAFTARDFEGNSDSKYINTSETIIYTKGDILYNYHLAKDFVKQSGFVIVVEGVMDVIAYYKAGIYNVVATLGTAMTKKQIDLIRSLSKNVVLSYDGDKAGLTANLKNGENLLNIDLNVQVVDNTSDLDPDEIFTKSGAKALKDLVSRRLDYIDFVIKYYKNQYNLDNYSSRKEMTIKVSALIDKLKNQYDRDNYANELYEITKIKKIETSNNDKKEYNVKRVKDYKYSLDGLTKAEYSIIVMSIISKDALDYYLKNLGYLINPLNSKLISSISEEYNKKGSLNFASLLDSLQDEELKNLLTTIATVDGLPEEYDVVSMEAAIAKIKREIKLIRLEELKQLVSKYENADTELYSKYLKEYQEVISELGGM